jgi:hypothetical protein
MGDPLRSNNNNIWNDLLAAVSTRRRREFKQLLNAVFSTVVIGSTAAILLCISVFSSIISKVDNWGEHE